ncbi:MAG TPA: hypothetical protein VFK09_04210 [Gemmatimonadales bacterium]|nr:hypothetical protein [Gemmatimonadales bacterium]
MRPLALTLLVPGLWVAACSRPSGEPAGRDLTLLTAERDSAAPGVVSARELGLATPEPRDSAPADATPRRRPVAAPRHATPAAPAPEAARAAPVPAPEPAPARSADPGPAHGPAAGGAVTALEPGQSVATLPATAAGAPDQLPPTELVSERQLRGRRLIIIGDDRCVPGRGELVPGLRHRIYR